MTPQAALHTQFGPTDDEVRRNREFARQIKSLSAPQLLAVIELNRVGTFIRWPDGWRGYGSSYHRENCMRALVARGLAAFMDNKFEIRPAGKLLVDHLKRRLG